MPVFSQVSFARGGTSVSENFSDNKGSPFTIGLTRDKPNNGVSEKMANGKDGYYCLERELHGIFLKIIGAKVLSRLVSITFIINSK